MTPEIIKYLNVIIADQFVLSQKIHNFHWNVVSSDFGPLHLLFGELYDLLNDDIDTLAERVRALQSKPVASLSECLQMSSVKEVLMDKTLADKDMIILSLGDFERLVGKMNLLANICAKDNTDMVTNNMLLNQMELYQKKCWMLRSHLI